MDEIEMKYCKRCGIEYEISEMDTKDECNKCSLIDDEAVLEEVEQVRYQQGYMSSDLDLDEDILEDMGIHDDPIYDSEDIYEMFSEEEEEEY